EIEIGEKLGSAIEYFYAEIDKCYIAKECNFYLASVLSRVKKNSETELIWISQDALNGMYHRSHQWIVGKELNLTAI
ncbi:MAG: NUDIX hydrolase, partial [Pyrinomonadaceae bacterium]